MASEVPWSLAFIAPGNNPKFYEPANARNVVSVGGSWSENNSNLIGFIHGPAEEGLRNYCRPRHWNLISGSGWKSVFIQRRYAVKYGHEHVYSFGGTITAVIQQMVQDGWFTDDGDLCPRVRCCARCSRCRQSLWKGVQGSGVVGPAPDPLQGWGRPNLSNLLGALCGFMMLTNG